MARLLLVRASCGFVVASALSSSALGAPASGENAQAAAPTSQPSSQPTLSQPASGVADAPIDITDERLRVRRLTAYTLPRGQFSARTGLFGMGADDAFASLGLGYGVGGGVELDVNVAHMGAGLINLAAKWMFLESGPFAFSAAFAPVFVHGDWVWVLQRPELVAGFDAWILPVDVAASWLPLAWLELDLGVQFTDVEVSGNVDARSVFIDAQLAARQFALRPALRAHLLGRASLALTAKLPLWTSLPGGAEVEIGLGPGVIAGGSSGGSKEVPFDESYRLGVSARSVVTKNVIIEMGVNIGPTAERLYGSYVYPEASIEVRF